MRNNRIFEISFGVFVLLTGNFQCAHAQLWSGIIAPTRAVDWSQVGIPGGIPARTQCGSTISSGASQSTIQSALTSCASAHPVNSGSPGNGGFVLLGAGTFSVNTLNIPSNVTLRGSGADKTILNETGSSDAVIDMVGSEPRTSDFVSVTGGATAGSQSITVASASTFTSGQFFIITQLNTGGVSDVGSGGTCDWCDGWTDTDGPRNQGQIVQITSISGTTINFSPALYLTYTNSTKVANITSNPEYAGVEALQLYANNTGHSFNVEMDSCMYCWADGIEGNYVDGDGDHAEIIFGFRDQISNSYFSSAYTHSTGSTENEILLAYKTSNCLIQNNILERMQTAVNVGYGSIGNVVSYNYMEGGFDQSTAALGSTGGTYSHGANPELNLFEGNVTPYLYSDSVWGTAQYLTFFRNWGEGTGIACTPLSGRGTVNCSGSNGVWQNQAARSLQIDGLSTGTNLVGDILGSTAQDNLGLTRTAQLLWPADRGWDTVTYGETFGYTSLGDDGSNPLDNTSAYTTSFIHGVYNKISGTISWSGSVTHTLPASFYLSAKPSWWRSDVAWPGIGPDVTGGTGPGGYASLTESNPAQACFFNVMGGTQGGAGSPYTFNATTCFGSNYSGSGSGALLAPSGLTAVVQSGT